MTQTVEHIVIPAGWQLEFEHAAGRAASRFLTALRDDQVLLASPCPSCGRKRVPPRSFCEDCFVPTFDEWLEVGPGAVIETFAITYADLGPGYRKPPHAIVYALPDGADTAICNWVEGVDLSDQDSAVAALKPGTRVRAVFRPDREARVTDFHWELSDDEETS